VTPPRLDASLRSAVKEALEGCDVRYTRTLDSALAAALAVYRHPVWELDTPQDRSRDRALTRAVKAVDNLLAALDAVDQAWAQTPSSSEDREFFVGGHERLRHEAESYRRAWSGWLKLRHRPKGRPKHRPPDARRYQLGLAVVWALMDAGVPLVLARKNDPTQDVLRVMLSAANPAFGTKDIFRDAEEWVQAAQAIHRKVMIEVKRRR